MAIQPGETIETENYKIVDRFGITLTYKPYNHEIYFQMGDESATVRERFAGYLNSRLCQGDNEKALHWLFNEYSA